MQPSNVMLGSSGNLATYMTSAAANASYLVFSNSNGDTIWKKYYPNLVIKDICIDSLDNIYFAGVFNDTLTITGNTIISHGSLDAIIGKINSLGQLINYKAFGTSSPEYANSLVVSNNEIIVAGGIINTQMVDSVQLIGSGTRFDAFVVKLNSQLIALSAFETISSGAWGAQGIKIAVDKTNNIYLLGNSEYTLSAGNNTISIMADGQFLIKFNINLQIVWTKIVNVHWSYGSYRPFIHLDSLNNIVLCRITGGGEGSSNNLSIEKYNISAVMLWHQIVNINLGYYTDIDNVGNIWAAGGHYIGNNSPSFSIVKVSPTGTVTQITYDPSIKHNVQGLAVKANNDFYIIGECSSCSSLDGYTCSPQSSVFMAHFVYGISTGMNKYEKSETIDIYPNPSSSKISINYKNLNECQLLLKIRLDRLRIPNSSKKALAQKRLI